MGIARHIGPDTFFDSLTHVRIHVAPVLEGSRLELPMCLLNEGMRGRQLIDDALAAQHLAVTPRLETDSVAALLAQVGAGRWATIVPQTWIRTLRPPAGMRGPSRPAGT
jgi:DNA-binding transcriptional LysR family regulator